MTVIGHSDLISNLNSDLRYLTQPAADAQISMAGLKSLLPVCVLASMCPYDYQSGGDRPLVGGEVWPRWMAFRQAVEASPSFKVLNPGEPIDTNEADKIQLILHLEGAHVLDTPTELEQFKLFGGQALSLTWNSANQYASGVLAQGGLTELGKEFLHEMARLGIWLDVSHLNEESFWGALEVFSGKVFASHSNARELTDSPRNLTKRQLHALRERGAWVGVSFARSHLANRDHSTIEDVVTHIDYLSHELGNDLVGLGTDFGGIMSGLSTKLESIDKLPQLFDILAEHGLGEAQISDIRGESFVRWQQK